MYRYIRAMAAQRSQLKLLILQSSGQIVEHILKILMFPNVTTTNHWESEIYAFLPRIQKVKGSNKLPGENFILDALTSYNDNLKIFIPSILESESEFTPADLDLRVAEQAIYEYQKWLAHELATFGSVTPNSVKNELNSIIEKYSR